MKLAWFSPLPPEHSEIANYTRFLTPELEKNYETRFFTEKPGGFLEPAKHNEYATHTGAVPSGLLPTLNRLDLPVYNLGNNPAFFSHTWFLSQAKPGIVVLHDLKLHHFFEGIYRERLGDQASYLKTIKRYYGQTGVEAGIAYWRQEVSIDFMAEHFPMTAWVVRGALGIVVHTEQALQILRTLTEVPVVLAPLPYQPRTAVKIENPQDRDGRAKLVIFGYLHANRRVIEFLRALADMPEREHFDVQILGTVFYLAEVEAAIEALGQRARVTLHGYVSEETLEAALDQADLAINLRYPTMGEASASQLRIWNHALPSLVTQTGSYADLPDDAVFFVRPEHEAADIQQHLRRFLAQPETFREAGKRGREYLLARHSPAGYVQRLSELCRQVDILRARHTQMRQAERVGAAFSPWADTTGNTPREEHYAALISRTF